MKKPPIPEPPLSEHKVVSQEEWLEARKAFLVKEKELTKQRDALARERRALPWVKVDKQYFFDTADGKKVSLSDLFEGRSQLFVYHFMLGPGEPGQCVGCSLEVDHIEGILVHLQNHDVSYVAVARATIDEIKEVRQRMGWQFPWVSSFNSDFNYDFHVSFTPEEIKAGRAFYNYEYTNSPMEDLHGSSVFYKNDAGEIFHTYSTFARGDEEILGIYRYLEMTPKGRNEHGPYHALTDWVCLRNMYGQGGTVEGNGRYHAPNCCAGEVQTAALR
jgi:predicted dithiol-disulfide oxidoreductase (DUF899 family)